MAGCFEKVLPHLNRDEMLGATHDNVLGWNSLEQVTLLSLVGEEFGLDIDFEELETASFADMLEFVRAKATNA